MKYRCAIVGCGRMGVATTERTKNLLGRHWFPLSHAEAIQENEKLALVAVCDSDLERATVAARALGLPDDAAYADLRTMLEGARPDVLSVATRTPGRTDIIRTSIAAGVRAIHSEKPLSQDLRDGDQLIAEIRERGIHFTYGTLRRFMRPYRVAKEMIAHGAIGRVQEIVLDHGYKELLMWTHPHSVDLLVFFAGVDVESVNAVCDFSISAQAGNMIDCDPRVEFARVRFRSGILGMITSSGGSNVRITGTLGALHILDNGSRVELVTNGAGTRRDHKVIEIPAAPSGTAQAFAELVAALDGTDAVSLMPEEVAIGQRLLWAIVSSGLKGGRTVEWAEVNESLVISGRFGEFTA